MGMTYMFSPDYEQRDAPAQFSIEHWLLLADEGLLPDPPVELAPFPDRVTPHPVLVSQLREWGILVVGSDPVDRPETAPGAVGHELRVSEQTRQVLDALLRATVRMSGMVMFPLRAEMREWDIPAEARDWGLPDTSLVVPKVPFLIGHHGDVTVAATSTEEGLVVHIEPSRDDIAEQFTELTRAIIDPDHQWPAHPMGPVVVPRTFIDAATRDEDIAAASDLRTDTDGTTARAAVTELAESSGVGAESAARLAALFDEQPAVIVSLSGSFIGDDGTAQPCEHASATITLTAGKDGAAWVAGPQRGIGHRLEVRYQSATDSGYLAAIRGLLDETAHPSRGREYMAEREALMEDDS